MKKGALGIIETYGYVGAIEAVDAAVKASMVEVLGLERVKGGRINITIEGDVAAVKAALDAAEVAGAKITQLITTHVIPRPDDSLWSILPKNQNINEKDLDPKTQEEEHSDENGDTEPEDGEDLSSEEEKLESSDSSDSSEDIYDGQTYSRQQLMEMRVVELRKLAREYPTSLERGEIKFANKAELVDALDSYFKEAGDING